jgi:hypothetical protein
VTTKRRGRGEGSIYRRGSDYRWVAVITAADGGGRLRRKSVYGSSRKAVADKLAGVQTDVHLGRGVPDDRKLLGPLLDEWLDMVKANRELSTWKSYEQRVRLYLKPALGNRPMTKVSAADVQRVLDDCRRAGRRLAPCSTSMRRSAPLSGSPSAGVSSLAMSQSSRSP